MNVTINATYNNTFLFADLVKPADNTIKYKGQTIFTLSDLDFSASYQPEAVIYRIKCGGKFMEDNLTICGKVIKCKGKIMKTDITINGVADLVFDPIENLLD